VRAQDTLPVRKSLIVPLKVNSALFDKLFGDYCNDTITHPKNKKTIYVLEKQSEAKAYVTSYKFGKRKWTVSLNKLFGETNAEIRCIKMLESDDGFRIRVFNTAPTKKISSLDLSLTKGKLIEKK
jgi:alpha-mannosidase